VQAAGSNPTRVGEEQTCFALQQGIDDICHQSGIKPAQIIALCAGIAGAARNEVRQTIARALNKSVAGQVAVVGDMVIAHEAALGGAPGIVVLSGTGSMAYGRHASGRTARAGGWGYAISDEGSGHWIGVQAVSAVTRALDSGNYTELSDRILTLWQLDSRDELIAHANASPPPKFSALFDVVLSAAEAGDSYAHHILVKAGAELARLAEVVFRRLWRSDDVVSFAMAGGIFQHASTVRESFHRELHTFLPQASIFLSTQNPAEGALSLARKLAATRP
jgi:N-acetylglucosamine kinase-like BadF-type ATPase